MKPLEYEGNLPGDLIREILVRLPVRLLLQLRIVCRSWNSLICSPEFAKHHLQRSTLTQPPPLLCWKEPEWLADDDGDMMRWMGEIMYCSSQSLILDRPLQPTAFESDLYDGKVIGGSCNGLLCLLSRDFFAKTLTLFNPSTRSVSLSVPFEHPDEWGMNVFFGFGYDILYDQYKFVMGCFDSDSKVRSEAIVFTFGANPSWKTVDHPVFPYNFIGTRDGIFVSGTLNWIVYDRTSTTIDCEFELFVLTFDFETELFGRLYLPFIRTRGDFIHMSSLQLHNNCLSLCYCTLNMPVICTLWIMKEYGVEESWIRLFEIPFDVGISPSVSLVPLYISEDHNLLALDESNAEFLVYNLRQNQLISHVPLGYTWMINIVLCHESLVSPSHYSSQALNAYPLLRS